MKVNNDYADDQPEDGMPPEQFLLRRAAAYRAYYEHMPLPARMRPARRADENLHPRQLGAPRPCICSTTVSTVRTRFAPSAPVAAAATWSTPRNARRSPNRRVPCSAPSRKPGSMPVSPARAAAGT